MPFAPYEGTEPYVFISYSHKDSARVLPILMVMYQRGYRVWYDEGIPWTSEWPAVIEEHLRHCAVCLAFHSQASVESIHCRREIHYALQEKKPFLSAYLEDVQLQHGLGLQLSLYQSIKLFPQTDEFVTQLERESAFLPCRTREKERVRYQSAQREGEQRHKKLWRVLSPLLLVIVVLSVLSFQRWLSLSRIDDPAPTDNNTNQIESISWGNADTRLNRYVEILQKRASLPTVTVAVIATGVDMNNPVFADRLVSGYDFVNYDELPQDEHGHGTAVAGLIVENTPDNVKIMPVRVLDAQGSGYNSAVSNGICYAVNHGANVICCPLGGRHRDGKDSAIQYAIDHNVTVVVPAGNSRANNNDFCPAHIEDCITVSSVGQDWSRSYFSNYGDTVDICAPGEKIPIFTLNGKSTWNGTSFSTTYVAAAVADIMTDRGTDQTPAQIEAALKEAAFDLGDPGWDPYYGAGFLDMGTFFAGNA